MAQRHGDRRFGVIVLRRGQYFGEAHDLAVLVGDLDTHRGLARNHLHHPHAVHCQRARQVLGQVGNTADLDPRGRLDLVTGNDRARVDRVYRDFDTELLELDFQQIPHGRQRLGRIIDLFLLGRIKYRYRRQGALNGTVDEQRRLFFFLHALARL
ncbi:hypothetical protein D9M71_163000 [compost metagenome]